MNIGSLAGGLADGFQSGYRTGILGANLKSQQANDERRLKLQEEQGARQAELQGLQIGAAKRAMEREQALDAAHKQALQIMSGAMGAPMDPNIPADQQVARFVTGGMNDPRTLSAVAKVYSDAGHPEAGKWLERAYLAQKEGVLAMADALKRGDVAEAKRLYNSTGQVQLDDVRPVEGKEGTPTGKYMVRFGDGNEGEIDPDGLMRSVYSYSEWRGMQEAARKAQRESEKDAAEIDLKKAQAENQRGDNPTKIRVAEIQADGRRDVAGTQVDGRVTVAGMRGAGGSGRGSGRGGASDDPWKDQRQRQEVLGAIDKMAMENYGERDPVKGDARHTEASRKISSVAAMIMRASVEASRDNPGTPIMSDQEVIDAAAKGSGVWRQPVFDAKSGRFVSKEDWSAKGTVYPLPSAVVAAPKEVLLRHVDEKMGPRAREMKLTPEDLKKTDNIKALAKQLDMSVDDVVARMLQTKPAAEKGGAAPGTAPAKTGITGAARPEPASRQAIDAQIAEREALLKNTTGITGDRRRIVETEVAGLRAKRDQAPAQTEVDAQRLADAKAKLAEYEGRRLTSRNHEAMAERQRLRRLVEELESKMRRESSGKVRGIADQRDSLIRDMDAIRRSGGRGITGEGN